MFFSNLKPFYLINESILVEFVSKSKNATDWIGLFPLGWKSLEDYITFEWVGDSVTLPWTGFSETENQALLFHPQYHSREVSDSMLYQFVYIGQQIEVLGKSGPFKFRFNTTVDQKFHTKNFSDLIDKKNENMTKCEKSETTTRLQNYIQVSDLVESLETQSSVQIRSGGKTIWIRKISPDEKHVQIMRVATSSDKYFPLVNFLRKIQTTVQNKLLGVAQAFARYYQSGATPTSDCDEITTRVLPTVDPIIWEMKEKSLNPGMVVKNDQSD